MSDVHAYVPGDKDNDCRARIRVPSMWGSNHSSTTVWCGAPEISPYHWGRYDDPAPVNPCVEMLATIEAETPRKSETREYATSDEDRCYYEDCWLPQGHEGLHAYHPLFDNSAPKYECCTPPCSAAFNYTCDLHL